MKKSKSFQQNISMIREKFRPSIIKYSILGLLIINVVIMAILIADISFLSMSDRTLEIVGTLLSGFLTVVLILVYLDISLTQDDILDIQSSQETLMEHEKAPKLIADRLQYTAENTFELVLSNLGGGYADGIRIQVVPEFYDWDFGDRELNHKSSGLVECQEPLSRQESGSDQPSLVTKDNYLDGHESAVRFQFNLTFECDTGGDGFFTDFDTKGKMRFHNLIEYSVASMEEGTMDGYMERVHNGDGLSDEKIIELADELPFNRLRLRFYVSYPGIEDDQTINREIADRMMPFKADLNMQEMCDYSQEFSTYNDRLQDTKEHRGGYDPIGAKISRDRTNF